MFERMMPRGPGKLGISKLNMGGMGRTMMKHIMKKKNVASLPELIQLAKELDVEMIACTMSMDVLGIKEEELADGLKFAGVATYLAEAEQSRVNLFI